MFGFFKKRAQPGTFMLVAVKSAFILRVKEVETGLLTHPDAIRQVTDGVAKTMNAYIGGGLREVTYTCVMAFLMDQNFIDRLIARSMNGSMGDLTEEDEREILRITKEITGIS